MGLEDSKSMVMLQEFYDIAIKPLEDYLEKYPDNTEAEIKLNLYVNLYNTMQTNMLHLYYHIIATQYFHKLMVESDVYKDGDISLLTLKEDKFTEGYNAIINAINLYKVEGKKIVINNDNPINKFKKGLEDIGASVSVGSD